MSLLLWIPLVIVLALYGWLLIQSYIDNQDFASGKAYRVNKAFRDRLFGRLDDIKQESKNDTR